MVCTLKGIDHKNDVKVFKTLMEPPAVTRSFTARFWTFWCHFYEKLFSFCFGLFFFLQSNWQFLTSIFLEVSRKVARARKRKTNRATITPFQFFLLANSSAEPWITEENRSAPSIFLWEQCLCLFQRWFTLFHPKNRSVFV